jgi:hypothetical protein
MKYSLSLAPVDENDIKAFELEFNVHFPDDYRDFLLKQNGGRPDRKDFDVPGFGQTGFVNDLYGIKKGEYREECSVGTLDDFCKILDSDRIPKGFVSIGDNGSGDQILLATPDSGVNGVFFFDHENEPYDNDGLRWEEYGNIYKVADSFTEFLESLRLEPLE